MDLTRLALLLAAASPLIASAGDEPVARLTQINGNVLVSTGSWIASATPATPLVPGMHVLPTSNSSAEVVFEDGCRVEVGPGERYEVDRESPCRRIPAARSESQEAMEALP